jgi:hypothetical protein
VKTAKKKAKAFRFPKTFTAKVTRAIFDASSKRRDADKNWSLMSDCPVGVAVRRALKVGRFDVSASRVDCVVTSPSGTSRTYTHDGAAVVKAFDEKYDVPLPQTVTFTLTKIEE